MKRTSSCDTNLKPMFFYGTLMSDRILERVIERPINELVIQPAILTAHARLSIRGAQYPALLQLPLAEKVLGRPLLRDEQTVLGTLVTGLNSRDVSRLDVFEGDEYTCATVNVNLMDPDKSSVEARAYLYVPTLIDQNVLPSFWSFPEFLKTHLSQWLVDPDLLPA